MSSRDGGILNLIPLVRLVEGEERWVAQVSLQCVLSQNWGGVEPKRTVICVELKVLHSDKSLQTVPQVFDKIEVSTVSRPGYLLNHLRMMLVFRFLCCVTLQLPRCSPDVEFHIFYVLHIFGHHY
ncbi:hypothetical protein TNCV_989641 [Trichonephila clavipes]|nr:hypothetical protein TNCV_989641 [Trichonephila clavipes]